MQLTSTWRFPALEAIRCAVVREAGFLGAVTTAFGTNTALTDPYALRRIGTLEYPRIADFASRHCWYKFAA